MEKLSIKQLRTTRFFLTLAFILLGYIAPILLICDKINIISKVTVQKISWIAVIPLISVAYAFKKTLIDYINSLEYSWFKSFALGISKVGFFILILTIEGTITIVLKTASQSLLQSFLATLDTLRYCLRWWCVLSILAHLGIRPFMDRCTHYIGKEMRKSELREVLKE
jgi:hypothetical protein